MAEAFRRLDRMTRERDALMGFIEQQAAAWSDVYQRFKGNETPNGPGSTLAATEDLRDWLPALFARHGITSVLDAPCGNWNWMQHVDLAGVDYLGWDVEPAQVKENRRQFGRRKPKPRFEVANLLDGGPLPEVDLVLCRDFLIHLPNDQAQRVLARLTSGPRFLLTTTSPFAGNDRPCPDDGHDGRPGYWYHPINLEAAPFNLAGRVEALNEVGGHDLALFDLGGK